jgi:hypothetical protein
MVVTDHHSHSEDAAPLPSNRKFGLLFAAVFLLLGLVPWLVSGRLTAWPWIASGVFLLAALAAPKVLAPLNRLWMKFGLLLHHIVSPVVLGLMFFAMIAPMGLAMRLLGKRPIPMGFDRQRDSYWIARTPPGPDPESLRNQF